MSGCGPASRPFDGPNPAVHYFFIGQRVATILLARAQAPFFSRTRTRQRVSTDRIHIAPAGAAHPRRAPFAAAVSARRPRRRAPWSSRQPSPDSRGAPAPSAERALIPVAKGSAPRIGRTAFSGRRIQSAKTACLSGRPKMPEKGGFLARNSTDLGIFSQKRH